MARTQVLKFPPVTPLGIRALGRSWHWKWIQDLEPRIILLLGSSLRCHRHYALVIETGLVGIKEAEDMACELNRKELEWNLGAGISIRDVKMNNWEIQVLFYTG